ncbi:MAG: CDP-alcohol phosphatidyltransferase family protein [Actinomyces sp.]|uniref:CDP-alcohol phosphatidyltransferase family protein n=1 Tax=Actinomyces sp. TaxID=29317 RepID=UPI0026DADFC5|nr:CDP-alcohol phosphatidyltransferase family protein [Actinomyces sp.]MDO4244202.1 CDP-alcohol phosphatidyltransferase family protein [Actinomyces sp.]
MRALDAAQKPAAGVPAYTRWVNRRGARVAAAAGAVAGWTPTMVTAASALLSVAGMCLLLLLPPVAWGGLPVAVALAAGYLLDSADGQLARLTGTASRTGEWVDHVVDAFRSPAIHLTTAVAVVLHRPDSPWLAGVALVYAWVTGGQFLSQILAEAFVRRAGRPQTRGGDLRSWVLAPTDPGVLCWSFILWGVPTVFSLIYTLLAVVAVLHCAASLRRRHRDLRALDAAQAGAGHAGGGAHA